MGKGDRKTRRGKITKGTFGVRRPRKVKKATVAASTEKSTKARVKPKPKSKAGKTRAAAES